MKPIKSLLALALMLISCQKSVDLELDRQLLLASNETQKKAHMENNPDLLVAEMMDTVLSIQPSGFTSESGLERYERWKNYFNQVKYYAWDDLEPPIIDISSDGTMASVSVRKITIYTFDNSPLDTAYFAWTSSYRKVDGNWKIFKITSINQ